MVERQSILALVVPALIALLMAAAAPARGISDAERGRAIAQAAADYDDGFGDFTAELTMTLHYRRGAPVQRELRIRVLEIQGAGDKSLFMFDTPADVRGTLMLTHSHGRRPDDQWLYLPALKRVKRIASANKSGPFVGSEFAYEDLSSQEIDKYDYRWLRDEPCGAWQCHVMERIPRSRESGYRRQFVWIDRDGYRVTRVEFHDRRDEPLKTLTVSGYRQYLDRYWRPARMVMKNHQTGKSTVLEWRDYRFRAGLSEKDFRATALTRMR